MCDLRIAGLAHMSILHCGKSSHALAPPSPLTELDLAGCKSLTVLCCKGTSVDCLDLRKCKNLVNLEAKFCYKLNMLLVIGLENLQQVELGSSSIQHLDVTCCTALKNMGCDECSMLTHVNASGCTSLLQLSLRNCHLLECVEVGGCTELSILNCLNNQALASIDLSSCIHLAQAEFSFSGIQRLEFSASHSLVKLCCASCERLEVLIVNGCRSLKHLNCDYCRNLRVLEYEDCYSMEQFFCIESGIFTQKSLACLIG